MSVSEQTLRQITGQLAASAEAYDRSAEFPRDNFEWLARESLIGLTVAKAYGGGGAGLSEGLRVLSAVAQGEPSTALILFMTYAYHAAGHDETCSEHIYDRLARSAVAGRGLIGGLRVEPELGTPARGGLPKTTARRTVDGWHVTGAKIYSTGSTGLDWFVVYAKTDEAQPRVGNFLVSSRANGITINPAWDHLGMRATVSHEVVFSDTFIPVDHAIGVRTPQEWSERPPNATHLLWNALAISTIYDGVARAARDWLRIYLNERIPANLGAPLASLTRVQEKFGEIEALLYANRVLIETAAERADAGKPPSVAEGNSIKFIATTSSIRAVEIGLELTGNPGLSRRNPLERHYRDVLCSRIHTPQNDTILTASGREGLRG